MDKNVIVRYAPSPTGDPHIGNIRTALFDYLFAKASGGKFILRIEDTDKTREIEGSIDRIKESLLWLGLSWDEGPIFQSARLFTYKKAAEQLVNLRHAYYCFCSAERLAQVRQAQIAAGKAAMYDKQCRIIDPETAKKRAETESHVIRLKVPDSGTTTFTDFLRGEIVFQNATIDDQVLLKSDGYPTYHLAVVVDDHEKNISHIFRGDEWISSTPKHVLLYQYLSWPLPIFVHLPLIVGPDKKKLSKRTGDTSLLSYKALGYAPLAIVNFLARLGFSPKDDRKLYSLDELAAEFSLEALHKNPAIFDIEKLKWFNRLVKEHQATDQKLAEHITAVLVEHGIVKEPLTESQFSFVKEVTKRVDTINDSNQLLQYLWQPTPPQSFDQFLEKYDRKVLAATFEQISQTVKGVNEWDEVTVGNAVRTVAKEQTQLKSKDFYQLLTLIISGLTAAPPLFASIALLPKQTVIDRLTKAKRALEA